jgi:penicillin-binding protein 2
MHDVTVYGTADFLHVPGVEYCAKTGTAQNPHGKNHSIFTCFAPKDNPRIAVSVVVENAGYGATWAGPIATLMLEKYLNDSLSPRSQTKSEKVSKTDLIPAAIKHWYYLRDSIRNAKLGVKEVNVDSVIEQPVVVPKKTTFDPEAEPDRNDSSGETNLEKTPMILPQETKQEKDTTNNE